MLSTAKQLSIALRLYKPARAIHRRIFKSEKERFAAYQRHFRQFVRPNDLVFDVGANIGEKTEVFLSLRARVVAFEPLPQCAAEVRARGNRNLTVVGAAVGDAEGFADINIKASTTQSSLLQEWDGTRDLAPLRVPVTTLDISIQKYGVPQFCKIDVEGYELNVLRGLSTPIPLISFEYHCREAEIRATKKCLELLTYLGDFSVNAIGGEGTTWVLPDWLPVSEFRNRFPNCVGDNFYGDVYAKLNL